MQINTVIHNFNITKSTPLPELRSTLWEMEHTVSGAHLCWLENEDENKSFTISFKTVPRDSTGVFHILEHSVLCGSLRYPVKKPVVELLKTSLKTFLNAFTFPDKTIYPLSSVSSKDFLNLISVYMDAVFHPALLNTPEIFRQEGWHYEFDKESGAPFFQGVVLNEMKGMCASPAFVLESSMSRSLFPDNCYRYNSGGDPKHITELTYEQFCRTHKTYYTPSNARILLAGKIDPEAVLSLLDSCLPADPRRKADFKNANFENANFENADFKSADFENADFENADFKSADFEIPMQEPVCRSGEEIPYAIGKEESPASRTIFSMGCVIGTFQEQKRIVGASVLADYLAGSDQGPLKRAVLENGLGQDVHIQIHDSVQQPWISCDVWNTDSDKIPQIKEIIQNTLCSLAEKGLDRSLLGACLQKEAFRLRDRDGGSFPKGIRDILSILDSWNYGGDPSLNLAYDSVLKSLEAEMDKGFFEDLLRSLFLDNTHKASVTLVPSPSLGETQQKEELRTASLQAASWNADTRSALLLETEKLHFWQKEEDTPEALNSLPVLRLKDADPAPRRYEMESGEEAGVPVLRHSTDGSLVYLTAYFNASFLSPEELPLAALLCRMLGRFPTAGHSVPRLQMRIRENIGELSFRPEVFDQEDPSACSVYLAARCVCLKEREEEAAGLLSEILTKTRLDNTALLKELLEQVQMEMHMYLVSQGNSFGILRTDAFQTGAGAARELLSGWSFAGWIRKQAAGGDTAYSRLLSDLGTIYTRLITARRMTVSASSGADIRSVRKLICAVPAGKDEGLPSHASYRPFGCRQEGLIIPASVGFAVHGSNLKNHGRRYRGSLCVLANILSYNYLWNEIRVLGGAYGAGFTVRRDGGMFFYTYRDPNPSRSLERFASASAFLRRFCSEVRSLDGIILGALAASDPLLTERARIALMESRYFKGIEYEDVCRIRSELLSTDRQELLDFCGLLDDAAKDKNICVIGGEPLIRQCSALQPDCIYTV